MATRRRREWFDDDSLWRDLYRYMFPESRFASAIEDADRILALTKPKGKAVLDLCCGPGRFSVAFAKRRFAVTGVDRTRYLLDQARARARRARVKIEWVQKDMRDFVRPESFDLVLSMFTSFGYFDDKREDLQVLRSIFASLRPGGACLMEMGGKEWIAKFFAATASEMFPDGAILVQRRAIFDDWTRIRNEWILVREGKAKTFRFHHTIYSGQELRDRMEQVGFTHVKLFGALDGEEYGPNSRRLIAVGRKPGSPKRVRARKG